MQYVSAVGCDVDRLRLTPNGLWLIGEGTPNVGDGGELGMFGETYD